MNIDAIRMLFDYNYWANGRILRACTGVSAEQLVAPTEASFGSLLGTLVHLLDSEYGWRVLCEHGTTDSFDQVKVEDFRDLKVLQLRWQQEERLMREYLAHLGNDDLGRHVRYTGGNGQIRDRILWQCLAHVVNHGTHHRSQAAAILKRYGCPAVALDMTLFLNEIAEAAQHQ